MSNLKTPVVVRTNVWAIWSPVCAIFFWIGVVLGWKVFSSIWVVGVGLIADVLGVIFGIIALRQIQESGRFLLASKATPEEMPERGKALARAGITIGILSPLIVGVGALAVAYWVGSQL